jgi:hypothetical protein
VQAKRSHNGVVRPENARMAGWRKASKEGDLHPTPHWTAESISGGSKARKWTYAKAVAIDGVPAHVDDGFLPLARVVGRDCRAFTIACQLSQPARWLGLGSPPPLNRNMAQGKKRQPDCQQDRSKDRQAVR